MRFMESIVTPGTKFHIQPLFLFSSLDLFRNDPLFEYVNNGNVSSRIRC